MGKGGISYVKAGLLSDNLYHVLSRTYRSRIHDTTLLKQLPRWVWILRICVPPTHTFETIRNKRKIPLLLWWSRLGMMKQALVCLTEGDEPARRALNFDLFSKFGPEGQFFRGGTSAPSNSGNFIFLSRSNRRRSDCSFISKFNDGIPYDKDELSLDNLSQQIRASEYLHSQLKRHHTYLPISCESCISLVSHRYLSLSCVLRPAYHMTHR